MKKQTSVFWFSVWLVSCLFISGCNKSDDFLPSLAEPSGFSADPSKNACVISKKLFYLDSQECRDRQAFDSTKPVNLGDCDVKLYAERTLKDLVLSIGKKGSDGSVFKVLDSKIDYFGFYYQESERRLYSEALVSVKYDCRGVAINARVYGPYRADLVEFKKNEHTRELEAAGYLISYISSDVPVQMNQMTYLTIYYYQNDPSNPYQSQALSVLKNVERANFLTGDSSRSLSDTLSAAKKVYPAMNESLDVRAAERILSVVKKLQR